MSVAQWAPWVSVFLGGCLSGAALLSLTGEGASDAKQAVVVPPPSPPSESGDSDESDEAQADEPANEADPAEHEVTANSPSEAEPHELAEAEEGPSAADILSALEQAYQRQIAAAEAVPSEAGSPEAVSPEAAPPEAVPPEPAPSEGVPPAETEVASSEAATREVEGGGSANDTPDDSEPVATASATRADQSQEPVQQIAVIYQPVYVLPSAANAGGHGPTSARTRSIGRDPWAPLTISPRHNPWASTAASGGAWSTTPSAGAPGRLGTWLGACGRSVSGHNVAGAG